MKTLLSILAACAITATPASSLTNVIGHNSNINNAKTNINLLIGTNKNTNDTNSKKLINQSLETGKTLEKYFEKDPKLEQKIKLLLEKSLKWEDKKLIINEYLFKEYSNTDFYKLIFSNNFVDIINEMYKNNLIIFDETSSTFKFLDTKTEDSFPLDNTTFGVGKVWTVHHWYWFLYWELHCDHEFSQNVVYWASIGADVSYFIEIISYYFPPIAPFVAMFAVLCLAAANDFDHADHGNGVIVPIDAIIPRALKAR